MAARIFVWEEATIEADLTRTGKVLVSLVLGGIVLVAIVLLLEDLFWR